MTTTTETLEVTRNVTVREKSLANETVSIDKKVIVESLIFFYQIDFSANKKNYLLMRNCVLQYQSIV